MPLVPFVALVPQPAQGQSGLVKFALQRRVGDHAEHRALIVGQNHRKAGARDLLVQAFHLRPGDRQELAHAQLQILERLRAEHAALARCGRLDAVLPQAAMP